MDLVNSVTQNSNNRDVTMENRPDYNASSQGKSHYDDNGHSPPPSAAATSNELRMVEVQDSSVKLPAYLRAIDIDPKKYWPKKYRFTRQKPPGVYNPLTIAQRNSYENNGFIVIEGCVPKKLLNDLRTQHRQSRLDESLIDKLVANNGNLLQYVKCFCADNVLLMTHRLVESFQNIESAKAEIDKGRFQTQQLFRDLNYLPFRPIDKVVCAVTAIEPVERAILVVPGTHKVGQYCIDSTLGSVSASYGTGQERTHQKKAREIFERAPENLSSLVEKSSKGFKYVDLKPGQTLFYHPGLLHGFSNDLVNYRKSQLASIAYYAAAECEYIDFRDATKLMSNNNQLPISLAHFNDKNPSDYHSWISQPRLLQNIKASL